MNGRRTNDELPVRAGERGFSALELLIVVMIVVIVTVFASMRMGSARTSMQLTNSTRQLAGYLEMARIDAIRRHAQGGVRAIVQATSANSYTVTWDASGDGTLETRTIPLPTGITFVYPAGSPPTATFGWRGRLSTGDVTFTLHASGQNDSVITVTSSGDVAVNGSFGTMPAVTATPSSADINPGAVYVNSNNSPVYDPSPTPSPTPLPVCSGPQKPGGSPDCRCAAGKVIDANGNCR